VLKQGGGGPGPRSPSSGASGRLLPPGAGGAAPGVPAVGRRCGMGSTGARAASMVRAMSDVVEAVGVVVEMAGAVVDLCLDSADEPRRRRRGWLSVTLTVLGLIALLFLLALWWLG